MNKIEELKQHNPQFSKSLIDLLSYVIEKPKYMDMAVRMLKTHIEELHHLKDHKNYLHNNFDIPLEKINSLSNYEALALYQVLELIGSGNFSNMNKFIAYNERKLIDQNDVSTYKRFSDLDGPLSLAELKLVDKQLQSQVITLLNTDEWIVVKPLSVEASLKYGASTKWCTAMKNDEGYFIRYSKRGILIYCINKITGYKIAAFKNIDKEYDRETSFWDSQDNRLDSMETNLPDIVLDVIKDQFNNVKTTNWALMPKKFTSLFDRPEKKMSASEENLVAAIHNMGINRHEEPAIEYDRLTQENSYEAMGVYETRIDDFPDLEYRP